MEGVIFVKILDTKAVNTDRKGGIALCVLSEASSVLNGIPPLRG